MIEHRGHLLLVEDEMVIALNESRILGGAGYRVSLVTSGEEAIEFVDSDPSILAVLLDLDLGPGIGGGEAARVIHAVRPELPILFLSAYQRELAMDLVGLEWCDYLLKSDGGEVLLAAVERALAAIAEGRR